MKKLAALLIPMVLVVVMTYCGRDRGIPRGMRAVSVHVSQDFSIAPGDRIDLLATTQGQTDVLVKNVEITSASKKDRVITFLVSPEDAERVTAASENAAFSFRKGGR